MTDQLNQNLNEAREHMDKAKQAIEPIHYQVMQPRIRKVVYFRTGQLINDSRGEMECKMMAGYEDGLYVIYLCSGHILAQDLQDIKYKGYERLNRSNVMVKFRKG